MYRIDLGVFFASDDFLKGGSPSIDNLLLKRNGIKPVCQRLLIAPTTSRFNGISIIPPTSRFPWKEQ